MAHPFQRTINFELHDPDFDENVDDNLNHDMYAGYEEYAFNGGTVDDQNDAEIMVERGIRR